MSLLIETDGPMGDYVEDWLVVLDRECCSAAQVSIPTTGRDPKPDVVGICLTAQVLGEARGALSDTLQHAPEPVPAPTASRPQEYLGGRRQRTPRTASVCRMRQTHTHTHTPRYRGGKDPWFTPRGVAGEAGVACLD